MHSFVCLSSALHFFFDAFSVRVRVLIVTPLPQLTEHGDQELHLVSKRHSSIFSAAPLLAQLSL
jgi:hypothetical protein